MRCVGQYREIPNVLDAAAESFLEAGEPNSALDRITRSARIHLARGDLAAAWRRVDAASELARLVGCETAETRLATTARLIQQRLDPGVLPENLEASDLKQAVRFGPLRHEKAFSVKAVRTQELAESSEEPHEVSSDDRALRGFLSGRFSTTLQSTADLMNGSGAAVRNPEPRCLDPSIETGGIGRKRPLE